MAENRYYAYCRVSKKDGMTIENQIHAIDQWAKAKGVMIATYYQDKCKGDTPIEKRSQLPVMLENLRDGDTVVVAEVFRLYRGVRGLEQVYRTIVEDKKAEFVTLNEKEHILNTANADSTDLFQTSMKNIILTVMALFSELEKKNVSTRTKRALQERKDRGVKLGRPQVQAPDGFIEKFKAAANGECTHTGNMKELKLKKTTYYALAKELNLSTSKNPNRAKLFK